jgi:drug/metabolite transporter (DMT)-like permease
MLTVVLAIGAAIGYGSADFAAGVASRAASIIRVTLLAEAVSVAVMLAAVALTGARAPHWPALAWGAVSGLGGVLGALALYAGFRHAAFSVAAPLSAVGAAGFSVLAGLLLGERPSVLALIGIALALPAIAGVSASDRRPDGPGRGHAGVWYGLAAGAGFAVLFIALNQAGAGSGLWPAASAQMAALAGVSGAAVATGNLGLPGARASRLAAVTGVVGAPGTILYFFATHAGFLAVAAVLASLYPAVTILLARVLLGERLTALRLTGLSLAAVSVALIAAGGAG